MAFLGIGEKGLVGVPSLLPEEVFSDPSCPQTHRGGGTGWPAEARGHRQRVAGSSLQEPRPLLASLPGLNPHSGFLRRVGSWKGYWGPLFPPDSVSTSVQLLSPVHPCQ